MTVNKKAYFKGLKEYTEAPEFTGVHITSAALNNYKGLTAFLGKDGNVYLGKVNAIYIIPKKNHCRFITIRIIP